MVPAAKTIGVAPRVLNGGADIGGQIAPARWIGPGAGGGPCWRLGRAVPVAIPAIRLCASPHQRELARGDHVVLGNGALGDIVHGAHRALHHGNGRRPQNTHHPRRRKQREHHIPRLAQAALKLASCVHEHNPLLIFYRKTG